MEDGGCGPLRVPSSIFNPPSSSARLRVAVFLAGVPTLALQLVWARRLTAGLGHEFAAVLSVTTATLLAMAAGAWTLHGRIAGSPRPGRWAAALPALAGLWVLASTPLVPSAGDAAAAWTGLDGGALHQWLAGLAATLLVAGVPAALLGAAFPALERAGRAGCVPAISVGGVYALNTLGALAGLGLAVGGTMPAFGFAATQAALGGVLVLAAALARSAGLRPGAVPLPSSDSAVRAARPEFPAGRPDPWPELDGVRLHVTAGVTGLLGLGAELACVRGLAQVTDNSLFSFAAALAAYLAGTAVGAGLAARIAPAGAIQSLAFAPGLIIAGFSLGLPVLAFAPEIAPVLAQWPGEGFAATLILALGVLFAPAAGMGFFFAWLAQAGAARAGSLARVLAVNLLGGALAGPLLLLGLLPWLGLADTLALIVAGYFGLLPFRRRPRWIGPVAACGALACLTVLAVRLENLPAGTTRLARREGALATVEVLRSPDGARTLRVNRRLQQGGTATAAAAQRHAHLPLLLHPTPREALFLGLGTGITMSGAAAHGVRADGVELLPEVVALLPQFAPENAPVGARPDWRVFTADARRFVRAATNRYDVIVADLFHPAVDGAAFLYTREHFAALRARLAPGGLVCQWLPLHQLDLDGVRLVARTFLDVFPEATLWLLRFNADVPVLGLIAAVEGPLRPDAKTLAARLAAEPLVGALRPQALPDPVRLLGSRAADADALRAWAGAGPRNTDDRPHLLFAAPRADLAEPPHARLLALLAGVSPGHAELADGDAALRARLEAFTAARDEFLRGLADDAEGRRDAAVRRYLAAAARSADFTPAYAQAALVAGAYRRENPAQARAILEELARVRPEQRLARGLLEQLDARAP
jgi:spermidine synthase